MRVTLRRTRANARHPPKPVEAMLCFPSGFLPSAAPPFLLLLLLLAALLLAGHISGAAAARELRTAALSMSTPPHLPSFLPGPELAGASPLPASSGGVRSFTLVLGEGFSEAGGARRWGLTVNGTAPGPVLEAFEGETLSVTVESRLEHDNATLHWHGMEQAGTWFMDGVPGVTQCAIPPGGRFHYLFTVDKPGTFWYHSHSRLQYVDGLLGALVINPKPKQDEDAAAAVPEFVLLAHEWGAKPFREVAGPTLESGSMIMGGNHDMMMGGNHDMMMGGDHNDMMMGGDHNDMMTMGGDHNDMMMGGDHNDMMMGGDHNEMMMGGDHRDMMMGGDHRDMMMGGDHNDMMMGGDHDDMTMGDNYDMMMGGDDNDMMKEHDTMAGGGVSGSMTGGSSMSRGNRHQMTMGRRLKQSKPRGSSLTGGSHASMTMGGHGITTRHEEEPVAMSKMSHQQGDTSGESKHQGEEAASGTERMHIKADEASSGHQDHSMMGMMAHAAHDADFPWAPHLINGKGGSLPPEEQAQSSGGLEVIRVKAGGSARLRVINGSGNWALRLQIEGHVLPVLTADAGPVTPQDPLLDYVLLGVGERMDILLAATQTSGAYWIYLSSLAGDHVSHAILLVEGDGAHHQGREGMTMQTVPSGPVNPPDVGGPETLVDQARALSAAPSAPPMPLLSVPDDGAAQKLRVYLTGQMMPTYEWSMDLQESDASAAAPFGMGFTGQVIRLAHGEVVDLELINMTPMDHPVHKHGSGFWVLDVQSESHQNDADAHMTMMHDRPLFKDTVTVPRHGRALIRVNATDAGPWLFHCHTKAHADSGMMAGILVGDPAADWAVPPPLGDGSNGRAGVCPSSGQHA